MKKKLKIGILFGGRSAEHEVSIQSAKNIVKALDPAKYEPVLIGIDKKGQWLPLPSPADFMKKLASATKPNLEVRDVAPGSAKTPQTFLVPTFSEMDAVFPVLHGPFGEDGTVQGLLKLANVPFVGPDVLGSAVGMDKDVTKRLLKEAGIPVAKFLVYKKGRLKPEDFNEVKKKLKLPFFVKPANLGSSVGISKVRTRIDFAKAIKEAFKYDTKIILEENIVGREIECAVLGNEKARASVPGEVIPQADFYSYDAKYLDENGALLEVPAKLPQATVKKIQKTAVQVFEILCCEGMARVDFFLQKNGKLLVNEINTIPGFTPISMYPKMWQASGLSYPKLIDELIRLAIERFKREYR